MKREELTFSVDDIASLVLRILLALLFGVAGGGKLSSFGGFSEHIHAQFDPTILAGPLLGLFIFLLPFLETVLGVLLLLGWMTRWALVGAAATLLVLFFGKMIAHDPATCSQIAIYVFLVLVALRNLGDNRFSIDHLMQPQQ
ncbi:DoxX family membrane protein [bacterium]|nr:DoxX family membrane protein [bacterium]